MTYLGKQVGHGQVRPVMAKISSINEFPVPKTQRELRRFLGMAGYYRCFCRNFSSVATPLTSLLSPAEPLFGHLNVKRHLTILKCCCVVSLSWQLQIFIAVQIGGGC